jgi:hypothetical protein
VKPGRETFIHDRCKDDRMDWPGIESRESREALLRAFSRNVAYWVEQPQRQLAGQGWLDEDVQEAVERLRIRLSEAQDLDALRTLLRWAMNGLTHSALVALDGGSEGCPTMDVHDSAGRSLGAALHEEWPDFALE